MAVAADVAERSKVIAEKTTGVNAREKTWAASGMSWTERTARVRSMPSSVDSPSVTELSDAELLSVLMPSLFPSFAEMPPATEGPCVEASAAAPVTVRAMVKVVETVSAV